MRPEPLVTETDLASTHAAPPPPPRRFWARAGLRAFQVLLGLNLGLGVAELAFRYRDGGAFPLVNVYEPDALRGVRLRPSSETRVGGRGERVTTVRVNADGYRGAAWPAPSPDDVVVIGDSLSFGLGVEEDEALAARLHEALLGRAVLDASVPTYGPPEYLATMEQILERRRPGTVVLVLNLLNDIDEIEWSNTKRHTAVDGWAMRVSEATAHVQPSAARTFAIQRSHAAYALWRWTRARQMAAAPPVPENGLGALLALADARQRALALEARRAELEAEDDNRPGLGAEGIGLASIGWRRPPSRAEVRLFGLVRKYAKDMAASGRGLWARSWDAHFDDFDRETGSTYFGGCGGGAYSWTDARLNLEAQEAHKAMTHALERYAALPDLAPEVRQEIHDAFAKREAAREAVRHPPPPLPPPQQLPTDKLLRLALTRASGAHAQLVVVVVPVDPAGLGVREAAAVRTVAPDVAHAASLLGAVGVDPTHALEEAGPDAYLPDGHLSAAGHQAVARAIAVELQAKGGG